VTTTFLGEEMACGFGTETSTNWWFRWPGTCLLFSSFQSVCLFCRRNHNAEESMLFLQTLGATYLGACQLW